MNFIYHSYLAHCRPYRLPEPWNILSAETQAFLGPENPTAALETLLESDPAEWLLASGLAVTGDNGNIQIHPCLSEPNALVLGIDACDARGVRSLMTTGGCIGEERMPFAAVLRDLNTRELLRASRNQLSLTADLETALVLRAAGLAAAPIGPLATLGSVDFERLRRVFDLECTLAQPDLAETFDNRGNAFAGPLAAQHAAAPGSDPSVGAAGKNAELDEIVEMVLVEWSPLELSLDAPAAMSAAISRLRDLETYRGLDLFNVRTWKPTVAGLERIQFAIREREQTWIRDAVCASQRDEQQPLARPRSSAVAVAEQVDLAAASDRLYNALLNKKGDDASRRKWTEAVALYRKIAIKELVSPLLREAQLESNTLRRLKMTQLAELLRLLSTKLPSVLAEEVFDRADADGLGAAKSKTLGEMLAINKQVAALTSELSKCKPYPKTLTEKSRPFTIDAPPCGRLGLEVTS